MQVKIKKSWLFTIAIAIGLGIVASLVVVYEQQYFVSRQQILVTAPDCIYPGAHVPIKVRVIDRVDGRPIAASCDFILSSLDRSKKITSSTDTDAWGQAYFSPQIPDDTEYGVHLRVMVTSPLGKDSLSVKLQTSSHQAGLERTGLRRHVVHLMTDKNWYQPGQDILFRALCLESQRFIAQSGAQAEILLRDALGKEVVRRQYEGNSRGICAGRIHLPPDILPGQYSLVARHGQESHEIALQVRFYQARRIEITPLWPRQYLSYSEGFAGKLRCRYFFGAPVVAADVIVNFVNVEGKKFLFAGKTDQQGIFTFAVDAANIADGNSTEDISRCQFEVTVHDDSEESESFSLPYYRRERFVEILLEDGVLLPSQQNRAVLAAYFPDGRPAPGIYTVKATSQQELTIGDKGFTDFSFTPEGDPCSLVVEWQRGEEQYTETIRFANYQYNTLAMAVADTVFAIDQEIPVQLRIAHSALAKASKLTLTGRQGEKIHTLDLSSQLDKSDISCHLPAVFDAGTLELEAEIMIAKALFHVRRSVALGAPVHGELRIIPASQQYRPGETAEIQFLWRNGAGQPDSGHASVAIVDAGILAQSGAQSIEQSLHDWQQRFFDATALPPVVANARRDPDLGFLPRRYLVQGMTRLDNTPRIAELDTKLRHRYYQLWQYFAIAVLISSILVWLLKHWRFFLVVIVIGAMLWAVAIPGLLRARISANEGTAPYGGNGTAASVSYISSSSAQQPPPLAGQLRQYFPETLLFVPELTFDSQGHAHLSVVLADNISSWRIAAIANGEKGGLAAASTTIQVRKELFVESDMPVALVRGDKPQIGWRIHNYSPQTQTCKLEIAPQSWFRADQYLFETAIPAAQSRYITMPIAVLEAGAFTLTATATAGKYQDTVQKKVMVTHFGRELLSSQNGEINSGETVTLAANLPENSFGGSSYLRIQPSPLAEMIEGLESMLRKPHGCFEQTSSINYPNLLILQYLRSTGNSDPQLEKKARDFLKKGYARLASFEVAGGGFSLYGNSPASLWLSAYGLRQLNDMNNVIEIDEALLRRTKNYVQDHLAQYQGAEKLYAQLALWEVGGVSVIGLPDSDDVYQRAIWFNLVVHQNPSHGVRKQVENLARRFLAGQYSKVRTLTYAYGHYGKVELAGWIAAALSRCDGDVHLREQILERILAAKSPHGGWGTTQATILALQALLLDPLARAAQGTVTVAESSYQLNPTNPPLMLEIPSDKPIAVAFSGTGKIRYTLVEKAYQSWGKEEQSLLRQGLNLHARFNKNTVRCGEPFSLLLTASNTAKTLAYNCILHIALAPGISPSPQHLRWLLAQNKIARYQIEEQAIVLYINSLGPLAQVKFNIPLSAARPGQYTFPAASLYEYYAPDNLSVAPQQSIVISAREKK